MTFREALTRGADRLRAADILFCDTPLLDASVLLAHAAGISREKLFASYPDKLSDETSAYFEQMIEQRLSGLPVSYIRNIKEFYGREFYVDQSVLVPRPDTEVIVEKALILLESIPAGSSKQFQLLDLCTGSGCIAVTLKLEHPELIVTASDISKSALITAAKNAGTLHAEISFVESNLFEHLDTSFDIIVTNPPYLTTEETAEMKNADWPEPMLALDGGNDGLDLIQIIIKTALDYLNDNSYLLIEAGPQQAEKIAVLLAESGFIDIEISPDIEGRNRVISGRTSGS